MNNKNKKIIIIISVIALFLVLGIGLTYAYFKSQIDNGDKRDVDVTSDTTDQLLFNVDNNINLSINQFNFGPGAGDLASESKATASLRANSVENNATYNYYVYFNIQENNFIYTTTDEKTEILLQITDPKGNKVTSIEGLKYDSTLEGFDITTASGLFEVANSYEIASSSSAAATIQEWNFTAKFINLDSDQEANTGKSMNGVVVIQRLPKYNSLQDTCKTGNNLAGCITNYAMDGVTDIATNKSSTNIYHHDGTIKDEDGVVIDANDESYRYAGNDSATIKEEYKETYKTFLKTSATTEAPLISFMCGDNESYVGATCSEEKQYYFLKYDSQMTQFNHPNIAKEQAIKDGYVERNYIDNFVCFGSTEETCPTENLYRIIGVFGDKIKLIKYDYANSNLLGLDGDKGSNSINTTVSTYRTIYKGMLKEVNGYYWNKVNYNTTLEKYTESGVSNIWEESALNKINLNTNYLNNIGETWANKIALINWNVSGGEYAELRKTTKNAYSSEMQNINTEFPSIYQAKIGLMYVSDYGYSRSFGNWSKNLSVASASWLNMGVDEWSISRFTDNSANYKKGVAVVYRTKIITTYTNSVINTKMYGVRPVFYLNSDVTYKSGDGSYENPIRIEV